MRKPILTRLFLAVITSLVVLSLASSAFGAATIVIQNNDSAGVGFNDTTPVAPVGGNQGTTLGQQRLNAFQFAANIWGAMLNSSSTITVRAGWSSLSCSTNSAVLGAAGAVSSHGNFPNAPFNNTWYSVSLANSLAGSDLNPTNPDINANFNVNLGNPGCLDGTRFYLGFDRNHGADVDLVTVLLHEFSHGLGFQTFTNSSSGVQQGGIPTVYDHFLFDNVTGKHWKDMTDAERQASAISVNKLAWDGARVTADLLNVLATPLLKVSAPGMIPGNLTVGTAAFGAPLTPAGVTGIVVQASPTDGCATLTNGGAISGKVAIIDRGSCNFTVKVKNAQDAGAIGVIIVNNVPGPPVGMGGSDPTITIPSLMVSDSDGAFIKANLGAPITATLLVDPSAPSGVDGANRALMFAPSPVQSGSSVSHWDQSLFPNQLMEPNISSDLTHSVVPVWDLTFSMFRDIGWRGNMIGDSQFYVRQHYVDFLNRLPDFSGLAFWNNQIVDCGIGLPCVEIRQINVSAAFFLSIEFQETGYLVERMYKVAYGDATGTSTLDGTHQLAVPIVRRSEFVPDSLQISNGVIVGQPGWEAVLENNKVAFANDFVGRTRFTTAYPGAMPPSQFVDTLNANGGNPLSQAQRDQLVNELTGGTKTRAQVVRAVAEDSDLFNAEKNRAFVLMQYLGYLRRDPNSGPDTDYTGYDFWLRKLIQFNGNFVQAEMVKSFIVSGEYRQRFGD